ncbi:hypothetical protein CONLIGDRAFT_622673 [Coniochaeta ligniaria NRRL 30616]|uniref:PH domain-containing protein n=1 Tax=Coniochaeta ligniaria NRRL 30616 TaxID=1408157 RepID=A0A1J7J7P7_9PEZI|nr:hypothetical protein CONLIGDRAFT_622673 [Coniochaeta ligniaria NRRL 30616]
MATQQSELPSRQATGMSTFSDDAVPDVDPSSTAGLLAERLQAWKHAVVYLEDYIGAIEKIHHAQAKEYEKALKTISKPLREGQHFDQSLGGVAGFFENMRANTEALINTSLETEKHIKGTVLPIVERLHKEIKNKSKELSHGAQKGAKEVDKARNTTQKHIELLGQYTATFESTGGKVTPENDPYVVHRQVLHRLNHQILEENNHRNDLIAVQNNFSSFEAHVIAVMQQTMEAFNQYAGGQAEKTRALYSDMLGAAQRIPPDFEWQRFVARASDVLINPNEGPRSVDAVQFPNMNHASTKPLIEGSLERKSRNKLSWGYSTGYYVVTPSKFLHEFKDSDNLRQDPKPELSIYLPDAVIGTPSGEKFSVKGKDRSKSVSSKLTGTAELHFKAHTAADAQKWFSIISGVAGATGPAVVGSPAESPVREEEKRLEAGVVPPQQQQPLHPTVATTTTTDKAQEAGVTGGETVASPTTISPVATTAKPAAGTVGTGTASLPVEKPPVA